MLQDNRRALKACSLTCKAMFASTRHLIHQTLHLTTSNNQRILTPAQKKQYGQKGSYELELQFLSFMAKRGLLKYARHLNIDVACDFSDSPVVPHLCHISSLDRIHTLTIHLRHSVLWRGGVYNSLFRHLRSTLTTLVLCSSTNNVLVLIPQFPNLQNLTLESLHQETWVDPMVSPPPVVSQPPPLRGHLRCASPGPRNPMWLRGFPSLLPGGINFHSVELQGVHCSPGQRILDMCAGSLEKFIVQIDRQGESRGRRDPRVSSPVTPHPKLTALVPNLPGHCELGHLRFRKNVSLHSIVIRAPFSLLSVLNLNLTFACVGLFNDTSLTLSEFVLELSGLPSEFTRKVWGCWDKVDKTFESFLRFRPEFQVVIRTGRVYDRDQFEAQAKERFPLMTKRGRIQFEISPTVDK